MIERNCYEGQEKRGGKLEPGQLLRSNRFKSDALTPVFVEGAKGVYLKAVRVGTARSLRTRRDIEEFVKEQFLKLGASCIKICLRGW